MHPSGVASLLSGWVLLRNCTRSERCSPAFSCVKCQRSAQLEGFFGQARSVLVFLESLTTAIEFEVHRVREPVRELEWPILQRWGRSQPRYIRLSKQSPSVKSAVLDDAGQWPFTTGVFVQCSFLYNTAPRAPKLIGTKGTKSYWHQGHQNLLAPRAPRLIGGCGRELRRWQGHQDLLEGADAARRRFEER